MHQHVSGSHRAMFDNDDFDSVQGIACEGEGGRGERGGGGVTHTPHLH